MSDDVLSLRRCAVYTRKSANQLLDRDVNSLETQRELCSAYIKSQQYNGWVELPQRYDDGGQTGGQLERPALTRLMQDIEAGRVDAVVVYKIDRLTRSLPDFVKLVEVFDRHNISFVSISQAFNTADSMGRMILNILLTFSQFERELISERIRDTVRMRKRHGNVHGGMAPFGYDYVEGNLQVVEAEADIVRFIFQEFIRTERYIAVMKAVSDAGMRSAVKYSKKGVPRGGKILCQGMVYQIIQNPIYVGEIRGHDRTYPGKHRPLISRETWEAAQVLSLSRRKVVGDAKGSDHFLAGILWDDVGRRMVLLPCRHRGSAYYSYVSSNTSWAYAEYRRVYRCNARQLDKLMIVCMTDFLSDRGRLRAALKGLGVFGAELEKLTVNGSAAAGYVTNLQVEGMKELFSAVLVAIELGEEQVSMTFRSTELRRLLMWNGQTTFRGRPSDWATSDTRYVVEIAVSAISGHSWPVVHVGPRDPASASAPDPKLTSVIHRARQAQRLLEENRDWSIGDLAQQLDCRPGYFSRLIRLNYLAPDIVTAILDGSQPASLTRDGLLKAHVPMDWALQRKLLGFPVQRRSKPPTQLFGRGEWSRGDVKSADPKL